MASLCALRGRSIQTDLEDPMAAYRGHRNDSTLLIQMPGSPGTRLVCAVRCHWGIHIALRASSYVKNATYRSLQSCHPSDLPWILRKDFGSPSASAYSHLPKGIQLIRRRSWQQNSIFCKRCITQNSAGMSQPREHTVYMRKSWKALCLA